MNITTRKENMFFSTIQKLNSNLKYKRNIVNRTSLIENKNTKKCKLIS